MTIQELQSQIMPIEWKDLVPHYERDAVIVISPSLDLATAAFEVAEDNKDQVAQWLEQRKIYKPSADEVKLWDSENQKFSFLILQPFVLIQLPTSIH